MGQTKSVFHSNLLTFSFQHFPSQNRSSCWVARRASWICSKTAVKALINNFHRSLHNSRPRSECISGSWGGEVAWGGEEKNHKEYFMTKYSCSEWWDADSQETGTMTDAFGEICKMTAGDRKQQNSTWLILTVEILWLYTAHLKYLDVKIIVNRNTKYWKAAHY